MADTTAIHPDCYVCGRPIRSSVVTTPDGSAHWNCVGRTSRPAQPAGEPVAQWQIYDGLQWTNEDEDWIELRRAQGYEARALYAHPSPQPADMEKAVEAFKSVKSIVHDDDYLRAALTAATPFLRGAASEEWAIPSDEIRTAVIGFLTDMKTMPHDFCARVLAGKMHELRRLASEAEGQERG